MKKQKQRQPRVGRGLFGKYRDTDKVISKQTRKTKRKLANKAKKVNRGKR